jgi:hypothetical protein
MGFYNLILSGTNTEYGGSTPKNYYGGGRFTGVSVRNNLTLKDGSFWAVNNTYPAANCNVSGNVIIDGNNGVADHHCRLYAADDSVTIDVVGTMSLTSGSIDWSGHAQGLDKSPGNITVGSTINLNMDGALHVSGGTHSANNWDKSSGPGTLHCWGDETVSSNDNMQLKGIYHEDCTATINCPQVMGNGGLQSVSGTATPTFNVGGWLARLDPPGNSTVNSTGTRDDYVGTDAYPTAGFWNYNVSGGVSTNFGISNGQNTTFKVFNDFEIQEGCTFSTISVQYKNSSINPNVNLIEVSGNMIVRGTYSGNAYEFVTGTSNYDGSGPQLFNQVTIHREAAGISQGQFYATSGATLITGYSGATFNPSSDNTYYRAAKGYFHHNSGTVTIYGPAVGRGGGTQANHTKIAGATSEGDGYGPFYNLIISGASIGMACYVAEDNDVCLEVVNDFTANSTLFYPIGSCSYGGNVYITDDNDSNCTFDDNGKVHDVSGNIIITNPHDSSVRLRNPTFNLYGNFINNGGTWY